MHDLVIRGGTIIDGSGGDRYTGDVAIDNGVITAVGAVSGKGREEIDAKGLLVTPGFVDVHTHYDAQVTWDKLVSPSCWHGSYSSGCAGSRRSICRRRARSPSICFA